MMPELKRDEDRASSPGGWVSGAGDRVWRCPDCRCFNLSPDALSVWTCERCDSVWRRAATGDGQ